MCFTSYSGMAIGYLLPLNASPLFCPPELVSFVMFVACFAVFWIATVLLVFLSLAFGVYFGAIRRFPIMLFVL